MENLLNKLLKYPWLILVVFVIFTAGFFKVMKTDSRMETDLDDYMPQNHPAFVYSNQAEEWFDIKDGIIIAIENQDGIYNSKTIQKVKDLTKALQQMKEINKADVTSLYTADNIIGTEEGMDVRAFYSQVPKNAEELEQLRTNVRNNEMIFGRLVSADEKVTVIIAEIEDDVFSQEFYQHILDLGKSFEGPERIHVAGRPIVEGTMALLGPADMKRMVPIVVFVIILVLLLVLRSIKSTFFTLLVVLFSTVWAFGLMAALGIPIYAVSTMIPVMLIAIGVADGIHLYSHLHLFMIKNPNAVKKEAVLDMIQGMWKPVVMTSVTTAVGFISLLTSQVYPIKYFGLFTAFGVMVAMMFSLVLIPAGVMAFGLPRWKNKEKDGENNKRKFAVTFSEKVVKYKYATIIITAIVIILSIMGIGKVWINSSFLDKFEKDSEIVLTDRFINENFGGTSTLNVILDSKYKDAFKNPDILKAIDRMQEDVDGSLEVIGNSFAITDYLKRMNKVMHADDEKYN
ncbi:MMPL family transporter, partial [bacterium]|nr:MMPL family transporter [bacterium]